jgi:hypothetical protein
MNKRFNVFNTCPHCGKQMSAETAFGRWMRNNSQLPSNLIVRSDTDHWILRHHTNNYGKDVQLLMLLEVKERGAQPDDSQRDLLCFVRQLCERKGKNRHGRKTRQTLLLESTGAEVGFLPLCWSRKNRRKVRVKFMGYHLLQFENTDPTDGPIKWDNHPIEEKTLVGILRMDLEPVPPFHPVRLNLRDRHRDPQPLFTWATQP